MNEEKSNAKCRLHYAMSVGDIYKWIDRSPIDFKHLWLRSEWTGIVNNAVLNYIALVEGGIGSVVLTALYGPLAKKDDRKISSVLKAAENFFRQIASIFVFYTIALACVYPIVIKSSFSWLYVASLTVILSFTLFIQYFFYYVQAFAAGRSENVYCSTVAIVDYIVEHHRSRCFD